MTAALRYEWRRLTTIRSTYWVTGTTVLLAVGLSFLVSLGFSMALAAGDPVDAAEVRILGPAIATQFAALTGPYFVIYLLSIIGIFAWGHEYRHGMIRATLTTLPSRTAAWTAKLLVAAAWVLPAVLLTLLLSTLVGWLWLRDDGISFALAELVEQYARTLVYSLVFLLVAMATTSLVRHQTAALALVLLWPLAVEPILRLVLVLMPGDDLEGLARFLPFNAGDRIHRVDLADALDPVGGAAALPDWAGFGVFAGFAAVLLAASWTLFLRRDA